MSTFTMLQNRQLADGTHVVYAWPADAAEEFCEMEDQAFTTSADRVIVVSTDRCALHCGYQEPCPIGYRTPPECPHERIDPSAPSEAPQCVTCGLVGSDESARYLTNPLFANRRATSGSVVMLGDPGTPEES